MNYIFDENRFDIYKLSFTIQTYINTGIKTGTDTHTVPNFETYIPRNETVGVVLFSTFMYL
jgi:hypothetical protein